MGLEPTRGIAPPIFKTGSLANSDTPPLCMNKITKKCWKVKISDSARDRMGFRGIDKKFTDDDPKPAKYYPEIVLVEKFKVSVTVFLNLQSI